MCGFVAVPGGKRAVFVSDFLNMDCMDEGVNVSFQTMVTDFKSNSRKLVIWPFNVLKGVTGVICSSLTSVLIFYCGACPTPLGR